MSRSRGHPGLTAAVGRSGAGQEPLAFMKPIHCPGSTGAQEPLSNTEPIQELAVPKPCHCHWSPWGQSSITTSSTLEAGVTGHYPAPASISGVIFMKQFPQPPVPLQASMAMLSHCHLYNLVEIIVKRRFKISRNCTQGIKQI